MYDDYENGSLVLYHGSSAQFEQFDLSKAKSGDGYNKYGHGIYLTDSYDTAVKHAKERLIGKKKYIYIVNVKERDVNHILNLYEDRIEYGIYLNVLDTIKMYDRSLYNTLKVDLEEYEETLSFRSLLEILGDTFTDHLKIKRILTDNKIYGVFDKYMYGVGKSYVFAVYEPDILTITGYDIV